VSLKSYLRCHERFEFREMGFRPLLRVIGEKSHLLEKIYEQTPAPVGEKMAHSR